MERVKLRRAHPSQLHLNQCAKLEYLYMINPPKLESIMLPTKEDLFNTRS
jgi:hypothetical protein